MRDDLMRYAFRYTFRRPTLFLEARLFRDADISFSPLRAAGFKRAAAPHALSLGRSASPPGA